MTTHLTNTDHGIIMLKIYNTLTRQKEEFKPLVAGKVGMYVCGVTIYDHCHIGHGRTFVAFDTVARYLRFSGYDLKYVRNITDVDDKIIKRATENNETCDELTTRFTKAMHADFDALNLLRPDIEPRVTTHMTEIIEIVQALVTKKHAYVSVNGDVLFSVESFDRYGKLSGQNLDMLQAGARVEKAIETIKIIRWTLYCGKWQKRANLIGNRHGVMVAQAGILNVQP